MSDLFSDIKLFPVKSEKLKANGSFVYNGAVRIDCTVVLGKNGLFVSLPREKYTDKNNKEQWKDKISFLDKETRELLNEVVVAEYMKQHGSGASRQKQQPSEQPRVHKGNDIPF